MRPSEQIERLAEALRQAKAQGALWRAQLISLGVEPEPELPAWAEGLTPNAVVLMQVLLEKWPHPVSTWALLEALPARDHAVERHDGMIRTYVCGLRKRPLIGRGGILHISGRGLRCSDEFHARWGRNPDGAHANVVRISGEHDDRPDARAASAA